MIDWYFGKPRSGKSYRAVKLIYDQYIAEDSEPDFKNILTNIGGFKFDLVNRTFLDRGSSSVAYKLQWRNFHKHLTKLYDMAMAEKSDDELNLYADYNKINDSLIIIDEASFHLKKYDDVISWFLAYHGHFRIRLVFIAQHPKQIYAEYLTHTEIYYEAQPQSKQLINSQIRYIHYDDTSFSKTARLGSDTISTSQDVFNLYKSGYSDKPKKVIYKFIMFSLIAALVSFGLIYYLIHSMSSRTSTDSNSTSLSSPNSYKSDNVHPPGSTLLKIRCDLQECWNIDTSYKNNKISLSFLKFVVVSNDLELLHFDEKIKVDRYLKINKMTIKQPITNQIDYYYLITNDIKNTFFSNLFQSLEPTRDRKMNLLDGIAPE
jgi:zona occludens toxin